MRINVYSQELTSEVVRLEKVSNTGLTYHAAQLILHSSDKLHHPPLDDDRSAVTFWLPSSNERREKMAGAFEHMAEIFRSSPPAETVDEFVTVPDIALPCGVTVKSFPVGKYLCSKGTTGAAQVNAQGKPWVRITFGEAIDACTAAGGRLITELQALAIAHDIAGQAVNWTGGAIGKGKIYQGLHKGSVSSAQPGDFVTADADERRWHELSNGERIFDFAGNAYSWVFDDVQGDEKGVVARAFVAWSPSITTAPHPSRTMGMGWRPAAGDNWSGSGLVRGGCWGGEDYAGVFRLDRGSPDRRVGFVGFRCTK